MTTLDRFMGASHRLGMPRVWDVLRGGRVRVLMYHGIPEKERFEGVENFYRYNVPLAEFERHMSYLAERCNVLSLRDFLAGRGLEGRRMNVVLTFDDGYENNFNNALPVLERLGLPAVFAIASGFVGEGDPLWNDVVEYAVRNTAREHVRLAWGDEQREFRLGHGEHLPLYNWLLRLCVQVDQERRSDVLRMALNELGIEWTDVLSDPDYRPLTADQVRSLGQSELVEVASHSVHHYLLGKLPSAAVRSEVRDSKASLEALTGGQVSAFCIPGGSYDKAVLDEIFEAGYDVVLTSDLGTVSREQRILKRCGIFSKDSMHWFVDQVHGPVQEVLEVTQRAKTAVGRKLRGRRPGSKRSSA